MCRDKNVFPLAGLGIRLGNFLENFAAEHHFPNSIWSFDRNTRKLKSVVDA
jgi:hypothetical protein